MSRRPPRRALLLAAAVLAAGCGSAARPGRRPGRCRRRRRPWPPRWSRPREPGRSRCMGGSAAEHNNFWQLFVRPAAHRQVAAGHPARGGQQRRPGGGQPRRGIGGGRVPAQPGPVLLAARHHPRQRHRLDARPARRRTGQCPRRPGRRPRRRSLARAARQRRRRAVRARRDRLGETGYPPGPGRLRRRPPVRAGAPHRRSIQPSRGSPAGSRAAPTPGPPASSPTPAGRGTRPGPRCRPGTHTRTPASFGSPPPAAPPRHCWRSAPDRRHSCWPPGLPIAAPIGPCHRRCRCAARGSPRHRPDPAAPWRWCWPGTAHRPSPDPRAHGSRCPRCHRARQHSHRNPRAAGTPSPSTAPGSPSGSSRPAVGLGRQPRPSAFSSSSGHRADASTRAGPGRSAAPGADKVGGGEPMHQRAAGWPAALPDSEPNTWRRITCEPEC